MCIRDRYGLSGMTGTSWTLGQPLRSVWIKLSTVFHGWRCQMLHLVLTALAEKPDRCLQHEQDRCGMRRTVGWLLGWQKTGSGYVCMETTGNGTQTLLSSDVDCSRFGFCSVGLRKDCFRSAECWQYGDAIEWISHWICMRGSWKWTSIDLLTWACEHTEWTGVTTVICTVMDVHCRYVVCYNYNVYRAVGRPVIIFTKFKKFLLSADISRTKNYSTITK